MYLKYDQKPNCYIPPSNSMILMFIEFVFKCVRGQLFYTQGRLSLFYLTKCLKKIQIQQTLNKVSQYVSVNIVV